LEIAGVDSMDGKLSIHFLRGSSYNLEEMFGINRMMNQFSYLDYTPGWNASQ
jgi:hypothetical protein